MKEQEKQLLLQELPLQYVVQVYLLELIIFQSYIIYTPQFVEHAFNLTKLPRDPGYLYPDHMVSIPSFPLANFPFSSK